MSGMKSLIAVFAFLLSTRVVVAQQPPASPAPDGGAAINLSTVRGCLDGQRGSYILIENKTNLVYVLKGVGNRLDSQLHREVEVKGRVLPGTIKTGVRPEKMGSNPSDTVHGIDGMPLQVADAQTDVRTIAKHCKAADQQ